MAKKKVKIFILGAHLQVENLPDDAEASIQCRDCELADWELLGSMGVCTPKTDVLTASPSDQSRRMLFVGDL